MAASELDSPEAEPVGWTDAVDEILAGDQCIVLATTTPASGVVLLPVTNFGIRDRERGTITAVNSSVGVSRKLERIRNRPQITLVYHTRDHAWTDRPEYVLVQGTATLSDPDPAYMDSIREAFEKYAGGHPRPSPLSRRWLAAWNLRVGVTLAVERILVWPDLGCRGQSETLGKPFPAEPPAAQRDPKHGTGPRINHRQAAKAAARKPHRLLGWVGADGYPSVVPVEVAGVTARHIRLQTEAGLIPPGGRRAGFVAHRFGKHNIGQHQQLHTGWMVGDGERALYAPHTRRGYWMPRSKLIYKLAAGAGTNYGLRGARRRGFLPPKSARRIRRIA